ncbi:uncharacterized protein [Amphiura filiformis]|uniref:uncharacterized protein isoform X2 n=1 Tax=Amphiura filiformis TaxID=82378 RepID=UPI003B22653A
MRFIFVVLALSNCLPSHIVYSTAAQITLVNDDFVTTTPHAHVRTETTSSSKSASGTNDDLPSTKSMIDVGVMAMGAPGPGGAGPGGGGGTGFTIGKMKTPKPTGSPPQRPPTLPPMEPRPSTIGLPLTTRKNTDEATSRHFDIISSVTPSGTRYNTDNTVATTTSPADSSGTGGLSTMAAFSIGLVMGISGFVIFGVLACVWYIRTKKNNKDNQYRADLAEPDPTQYMHSSPTQTTFISRVSDGPMANHTYEEAGIPGQPMTPYYPTVPNRVPESRYSRMPGEVVICTDGYARYRPSVSEQVAEHPQPNSRRMYRTLSRPSGSTPDIFMDGESSAERTRSYSLSAEAYTSLNMNAVRRPTVIGQDGYAEYVSDETRNRSRSYSELHTRNIGNYDRPTSPKKCGIY